MKHRPMTRMGSPVSSRSALIVAAAGTALLAAGSFAQEQQGQRQDQQQAPQGQQQAQQGQPQAQQGQQQEQEVALLDEPAFVEETEEARATVMEVEPETRIVSLRADDGEEFTVQAGDDVDLANIGEGDTVDVVYYAALAAEVTTAPPGREPIVIASSEAPIGQPGGAVGLIYTAIVTIDDVDTESNTVAFTNPEGEPREVTVERPELQQFLAGLEEGDTVQVTYGEALAVSLTPAE
ncbi:MAG TPA: hypothetical protein VF329_00040 [Gammaproteobacteria bacterium]